MLLDGLRSCEVLALRLEDLQIADAQLHVLGKGNKTRVVPLPGDLIEVLQTYLRVTGHGISPRASQDNSPLACQII